MTRIERFKHRVDMGIPYDLDDAIKYHEPQVGTIQFNDPNYRPVGEKLGGKGKRDKAHNEKIAELIRENEELTKYARALIRERSYVEYILNGMLDTERKRSARWKAVAKKYHQMFTVGIRWLHGEKQ